MISLWVAVNAQEDPRADAIEQVYKALTATGEDVKGKDGEKLKEDLERGAWEALSYMEENPQPVKEDLQEAVPDYYHFKGGEVLLKLISPKNRNEYGTQLTINYKLANNTIELTKKGKLEVVDRWVILYLDENYMALDMGQLRVFFTHAPEQE